MLSYVEAAGNALKLAAPFDKAQDADWAHAGCLAGALRMLGSIFGVRDSVADTQVIRLETIRC